MRPAVGALDLTRERNCVTGSRRIQPGARAGHGRRKPGARRLLHFFDREAKWDERENLLRCSAKVAKEKSQGPHRHCGCEALATGPPCHSLVR